MEEGKDAALLSSPTDYRSSMYSLTHKSLIPTAMGSQKPGKPANKDDAQDSPAIDAANTSENLKPDRSAVSSQRSYEDNELSDKGRGDHTDPLNIGVATDSGDERSSGYFPQAFDTAEASYNHAFSEYYRFERDQSSAVGPGNNLERLVQGEELEAHRESLLSAAEGDEHLKQIPSGASAYSASLYSEDSRGNHLTSEAVRESSPRVNIAQSAQNQIGPSDEEDLDEEDTPKSKEDCRDIHPLDVPTPLPLTITRQGSTPQNSDLTQLPPQHNTDSQSNSAISDQQTTGDMDLCLPLGRRASSYRRRSRVLTPDLPEPNPNVDQVRLFS